MDPAVREANLRTTSSATRQDLVVPRARARASELEAGLSSSLDPLEPPCSLAAIRPAVLHSRTARLRPLRRVFHPGPAIRQATASRLSAGEVVLTSEPAVALPAPSWPRAPGLDKAPAVHPIVHRVSAREFPVRRLVISNDWSCPGWSWCFKRQQKTGICRARSFIARCRRAARELSGVYWLALNLGRNVRRQ
jgi:hypothetical protein